LNVCCPYHYLRPIDDPSPSEPTRLEPLSLVRNDKLFEDLTKGIYYYIFKGRVWRVQNCVGIPINELGLHVKHAMYSYEKSLSKIEREVRAFENNERVPNARRERIPDNIRLFVWQRDGGKCVLCGKQERLEYDHLIPVAEGGGNTERNIQLLCETCNREKGKKI
jgi:HNH endonuclease